MNFWRWTQQKNRPHVRKPDSPFQPAIDRLEARDTPSTLAKLPILNGFIKGGLGSVKPATSLRVVANDEIQAGKTMKVVVEASTASNQRATSYRGTIHFSLGTADAGATLPADYTFTAADKGRHTFQITLSAVGSQTIKVADTTTSTIAGSAITDVTPAPVATKFLVKPAIGKNVPGLPTPVLVVAQDANGKPVPTYTGTVTLTSSDAAANLPSAYTFKAADKGRHVFMVTLNTSGKQTVTATDAATPPLTGNGSINVLTVGPVTHFRVLQLPLAIVGRASPLSVVALDANNRIVANYTGTVKFSSTDSAAVLPSQFTFTAADKGVRVFSVTFNTVGKQSLTVTDVATATITATAKTRVVAKPKWVFGLGR